MESGAYLIRSWIPKNKARFRFGSRGPEGFIRGEYDSSTTQSHGRLLLNESQAVNNHPTKKEYILISKRRGLASRSCITLGLSPLGQVLSPETEVSPTPRH
eukprot:5013260-Pyramimonas_sp.AAC.2